MFRLCQEQELRQNPFRLFCCPSRLWAEISMDFLTGLPISKGKTIVLTVVDRFSKMAHFLALPKLLSAKEIAETMMNKVFRIH